MIFRLKNLLYHVFYKSGIVSNSLPFVFYLHTREERVLTGFLRVDKVTLKKTFLIVPEGQSTGQKERYHN